MPTNHHGPHPGGYKVSKKRMEAVFDLIAQGYSNTGISNILGLTTKTVERYTREINEALDLQDDPDRNKRVMAVLLHQRGVTVSALPGPADGHAPQRPG